YRGTALAFNTNLQNPKVLNEVLPADVDRSTGTDGNDVFTRPVLVGHFRVWRDHIGLSAITDLYILNNHFSSGPDRRVGQRKEQAAYNAAVVAALRSFDAEARILVGGDLNVFPRPDDPFAPGNPRFPSDQLAALYGAALTNLYDRLVSEVPSSAYSFVFEGQAQTLDMMFINNAFLPDFVQIRSAKINTDWPAEHDEDGARGVSDHDPQVARFKALTVDALTMLVRFYQATGAVAGSNTAAILLEHLARARQFAAAGQRQAFRNELRAFMNQVEGFSPQFVTRVAADVLKREADRLRNVRF
ncbi:MAG: endonuclease/exonuclease/phosphatase family protein, partial [Gammaproteobacteria bacterium]